MEKFLSLQLDTNLVDFNRIDRLQQKMNNREPWICVERAEIITKSFKETEGMSIVVRRAIAYKEILENMSIYIEDDSIIFGNQASKNFAAPVFPEYSFNWVIDELDEFEKRSGDYFKISEDSKERLKVLQPYWQNITHQDEVLRNLSPLNRQAETQNVLHRGGISMSGDGHIIPNHEFVLEHGYGGMKKIAEEKLENRAKLTQEQIDYYEAAIITMDASLTYIKRFSKLLAEKAAEETDSVRKQELLEYSNIYSDMLEGGARNFYEAVECVYLTHLLMMIESNGHSFSFGRFDQFILPFYEADVEKGVLTKEKALEITTHFFIMTNSLNKVRPWGHTQYSGGYPLYSNLMLSGMKPDGTDGTNDLSYICLEAMNQSRLPEPNLSVRYCEKTPHAILKDSAKLIREGFGMPSMFCDEVVIPAMMTLDLDLEVARDYASMGCVETAIPGKWGHRATGMTYINFGKILEIILNNGVELVSGIQLFSINGNDGKEIDYKNFDELWDAWKMALKYYFELAIECDNVCDRSLKYHDADAFASSTINCCLERGKTLKNGGSEYDYISQSNIGPCVIGDSMAAIKKLIFEEKKLTFQELMTALEDNFEGENGAKIRKMCLEVPKFGNDDDYVDHMVAEVFESYLELLPNYRTDRHNEGPKGCRYTMSTSNITSYVPNGFDVGATPDGRLAGEPLNEGASPCVGADKSGPTAVIRSISKLPNQRIAGGQLLNMRFAPDSLKGEENLEKFTAFIESARHFNVFHNQFNIVDSELLRKAKEDPIKYNNVMVRVAGYCALFTTLMPEAQDAIINRSEHRF